MLLSPPLSHCTATAQSLCRGPIQPLGCNTRAHSAVTLLVTRDGNFGNQTPPAPRIRCPSPPSPSLHTSLPPLCALPRVPPSHPQPTCPLPSRRPSPAAQIPAPSAPSPLGQPPLMLLHCVVLVSGSGGAGVGGCWGGGQSAGVGQGHRLSLLGFGRLRPVLWLGVGNPPRTGPALGEGLVLSRFPLVPAGKGPGLAPLWSGMH